MTQNTLINILLYLNTLNLLILGALYLLSVSLERYRESLDDFASYLYSLNEEGEDDDSGTRTTNTDE